MKRNYQFAGSRQQNDSTQAQDSARVISTGTRSMQATSSTFVLTDVISDFSELTHGLDSEYLDVDCEWTTYAGNNVQ